MVNKNFKYILIDLDGTISDSSPGITKSVQQALKAHGIHEETETLKKFIGPPMLKTLREDYAIEGEQAKQVVEDFHHHFDREGWNDNTIYEGVKDTLEILKNRGKKLSIATAKIEHNAIDTLEYFEIADYFDYVAAPVDDFSGTKAEMIERILSFYNFPDPGEVLMVGDTMHDFEAARAHGISFIFCDYGFGSLDKDSKPLAVITRFDELLNYI